MIFFAWIVVLGNFVHTQALNPRSVNVALETVLEFDGKHNSRDIKAIDKLQNYLNRIKKILNNNDESRRNLPQGFKFRDFLKSALRTVASYDDNDLLDVASIVNDEIRKYHYKGCKFHELVENVNMRRDMAERLITLNDLTAKELRAKLSKAAETIEADTMTEQKKKMLDYLDSIYVGDDIKNKMELLVSQLDQFRRRSKRANLNLDKVINQGLRAIVFDYYTNLNINARKELKDRLETLWYDYKNLGNVKDVWKKALTPKAFNVAVNNFEIVYPKKNVFRSKSIKRVKKKTVNLEPRSETDISKLKRAREDHLQVNIKKVQRARKEHSKKMPKALLRKKTDRFKKYKKKDKLRTLKPSSALMTSSEEDFFIDHGGQATVKQSIKVAKARMRSKRNQIKQKKGQHKRKHQYAATEPTVRYFRKSRRSNDYDELFEEGLHIESFEKQKSTNSLRRNFDRYSNNDSTGNKIETAVTPNVINKIDKIEKVLDEIKSLVSLRRKNENEVNEKIPTTTKSVETGNTVTTTEKTKITSPTTESTIQETTTEKKNEIIDEIKSKRQTTIVAETDEDDTKILTESEAKTTTTTPENLTDSVFTTKQTTMKSPELESTVNTSSTLDLISNDTRRSDKENVKDKSRSVREVNVSDLNDLDIDVSKTKRPNDNFKDMVKDKLKSVKDHDLTDRDGERKYNENSSNDKLKNFDKKKIGKYHEFSYVKLSKEHYLNDDFDEFVSDKKKVVNKTEFSDMEEMQGRRSNDNPRKFNKEQLKLKVENDLAERRRHDKHNTNYNFKDLEHDKQSFGKKGKFTDMEVHSRHHKAEDFAEDEMKFGISAELSNMDIHSKDRFKDVDKDKMALGKGPGLTDIERMQKLHINDFNEFDDDKINIAKDKLTDHDVESLYESHKALKDKHKDANELSDVEIEHMYNETRRAHIDKIMDINSEADKERNKRVRDKIAGHMKTIMGMKGDGQAPNKFDFNIDDPFNLKEDDFGV